jgi:M6 family metalloprotease-like protein
MKTFSLQALFPVAHFFSAAEGRSRPNLWVIMVCSAAMWSPRAMAASAYDEWIQSFPGLSVWNQAPTADPDQDGLANVAEQLLDLNPTVALPIDPNRDNAPGLKTGPGGSLQFGYRVNPFVVAEGEITHGIQNSIDLRMWHWMTSATDGESYWTTLGLDQNQEFFRAVFSHTPPAAVIPKPTFSARSEETLGIFDPNSISPWQLSDAADGSWRGTYRETWTNLRGGMWRKMAANFLVEGDEIPVAAMFSAEAYVAEPGKHLFVRVLVDGQPMKPADVLFASGGAPQVQAARSFEFTGKYDRGLHTLEVQWLGDENASGFIRDAAILIRQGDIDSSRGALLSATPASGSNIETKSTAWVDVPGLEKDIQTEDRDSLIATVSAEASASSGESVWIRVLVDGVVADPGPVEFAAGAFEGTRTMAFGMTDLDPGTHEVRVQWHADSGGTAVLGDRTLTVSAGASANSEPMRILFDSANDEVPAPAQFNPVPGLSHFTLLPADSDVSVIFSAEFPQPAGEPVWARLRIGGTPVPESEVLLTDGDARAGVHSFTFDAKHLGATSGSQATTVSVEWRSDAAIPPEIAARSMVLYVKQHAVPDLAEPPKIGLGYTSGSFGVEPMFGTRNVLVILFDPNRPGHAVPTVADLTEAFFGASDSIADYYEEVSEGRLKLKNAGVLGPYPADNPWGHYWNGPGDHQDKWVEAVTKASANFNFADYDFDGDGYISAWDELAIFIVVPQTTSSGFVRNLWSGQMPLTVDGVYLDLITEWYVSDPVDDYHVGAHEFGHQVLMLGDLYAKSGAAPKVGTQPGAFCLMDQGGFQIAQHLNPVYKLALGWVTPRLLTQDTAVSLVDVKVSRELVVLPRSPGGDSDEYVVLENRPSPPTNARYDFGLPDAGIAVWHIVESPTDSVNPPTCTAQLGWDTQTGGDNARRGIRLVRPSVSYSDFNALWNNGDYDLDAFGLVCPGMGAAHNILVWSDGSQSYEIRNFSGPGAVMTFDIINP